MGRRCAGIWIKKSNKEKGQHGNAESRAITTGFGPSDGANLKRLGDGFSRFSESCPAVITAQTSSKDGTHQHSRILAATDLSASVSGVAIIAIETVQQAASPHRSQANQNESHSLGPNLMSSRKSTRSSRRRTREGIKLNVPKKVPSKPMRDGEAQAKPRSNASVENAKTPSALHRQTR